MNKTLPYVVAAVVGLICTQAQAQAEGQQACGNDAFALCQEAIPDAGRVAACLRKNFSRVSAPCRLYMASYGRSHRATRHAARRHHERYSARRHHRRHRHARDEG